MSSRDVEEKLLLLTCTKLKKLINSRSVRNAGLDSFVVSLKSKHYAVRVTQVAQRPTPVFHATVYNADGVYQTAMMVTEAMLTSLGKGGAKKPAA